MNGTPSRGAARLRLRFTAAAVVWLAHSTPAVGADVVFIRSREGLATEQRQMEIAAEFYGLNLNVVAADAASGDVPIPSLAARSDRTVAVVIAADALGHVRRPTLLRALQRRGGGVPLLILGVTPQTDAGLLKRWSGRAVLACARAPEVGPRRYVIGRVAGITRELSGVEMPTKAGADGYLVQSVRGPAEEIVRLAVGRQAFPVFVKSSLEGVRVFLASTRFTETPGTQWSVEGLLSGFAEIAPAMMFLRHAADDRAWHPLHAYANLTIDDPWLREPYGGLRFNGLLAEMEVHNFHTTIAFIPWNYDRSRSEVVSLIRNHPERFSICVHGNNHDHKEFTDYLVKPLASQIAGVKQALARMDRFRSLTGIAYDKVMVFPHSIAPESTLAVLKSHNYLATVNSSNVPMDRRSPPLLPFALRPVTMSFGNFESIRRYPPQVAASEGFLAMNVFLENPLLFYGHHDLFAAGIEAFNGVARHINRLQPDMHWRGLGEIVKHSYLLKRRDDQSHDVQAFSKELCLDNLSSQETVFHVKKQENGSPAIASLRVDGQQSGFEVRDGYLVFSVLVPARETRTVEILYENNGDKWATVSEAWRKRLRVYLIRMASDFRDITLSRYAAGRAIVRLYSTNAITPTRLLIASATLLACLYGCWRLFRMSLWRRRRPGEPANWKAETSA